MTMAAEIRPYAGRDREAVRSICMTTAQPQPRSESKRFYLFQTACDYYLDCEPENCFVAEETDENGEKRIVGYLLCAADCEDYARRFKEKYMPKLKQYGKLNAYFARTDVMLFGQFAAFFPAHIRISVLPAWRRQGIGRALVEAIQPHLAAQRGKGIVAVVTKRNTAAKAFFAACGFSVIRDFGGGTAYGLDL